MEKKKKRIKRVIFKILYFVFVINFFYWKFVSFDNILFIKYLNIKLEVLCE